MYQPKWNLCIWKDIKNVIWRRIEYLLRHLFMELFCKDFPPPPPPPSNEICVRIQMWLSSIYLKIEKRINSYKWWSMGREVLWKNTLSPFHNWRTTTLKPFAILIFGNRTMARQRCTSCRFRCMRFSARLQSRLIFKHVWNSEATVCDTFYRTGSHDR